MEVLIILLIVVCCGVGLMFALVFLELIWTMPPELVEKVRVSNEYMERRTKHLKLFKVRGMK